MQINRKAIDLGKALCTSPPGISEHEVRTNPKVLIWERICVVL